jgi:hypothetical protein
VVADLGRAGVRAVGVALGGMTSPHIARDFVASVLRAQSKAVWFGLSVPRR